ncbi:group-specific protein [Metabacillus halosaccharovorans]|uniref:group-specific protein n=1 Tax=Metabacillus halosaccharovorans TaxID=930124 RepID=UPI0009948FA4|nr:group-specific protein [Metabacillus halosaccharovorans]
MSNCKIDHSSEDVKKKLQEQSPFLNTKLVEKCLLFLSTDTSQTELNELFHLLKKYDLSTDEEKNVRNRKIEALISN